MNYNALPVRKNIRLKNYNYTQTGHYFITICTENKKNILCKIVGVDAHVDPPESLITLTDVGKVIAKHINNINKVYTDVKLDCYTIMPNHIHLIVVIRNNSQENKVSIPQIVKSLKVITTKKCGDLIWQRNYYEHIIRCEQELKEIREYIQNNPMNWNTDMFF